MSVELLKSGLLYVWFALQFWRLRFAATNLFMRVRVTLQLDFLKKCLDVERIPKPRARSSPAGTHKEIADEQLYEDSRETCVRLEACVQSAFA
eukprot:15578249-Heterocapsa_arctica.AAC.1